MISGNFYSALGVQPALGRAIGESDDGEPGSGPVIVISDRYWTNRFSRSPSVIGKTISINLTPMTIVGVNSPGFTGHLRHDELARRFYALQHAADRGAQRIAIAVDRSG